MNFFQKLTGSLKMPQDEELFPEESSQKPSPPQQKTNPGASEPFLPQEDSQTETKAASFKQMLAAEEDTSSDNDFAASGDADSEDVYAGTDEPGVDEPDDGTETNLATASLASARAPSKSRLNPIKKGLASLRFKKEEKEELGTNAPEGQLAIDVYETPEEVVIKSTIAGVKPQDLDVGIEDNTVNIRGSRHNEEKVKGEDYFYQECYWGTFSRSIILPVEVDVEKAQATLKDGILTIRLPKIIKERERKIKILS